MLNPTPFARHAFPLTSAPDGTLAMLPIVPYGYGVHAVDHGSGLLRAGEVVVFDPRSISAEGLIADALYVAEYQTKRHASLSDRLHIDRHIVRLTQSVHDSELWVLQPVPASIGQVFRGIDGPMLDHLAAEILLGRIVGIYNPTAIGG